MIWLPVTVGMIGKFLISMTFAIAYLYTAELFPTIVRNVAVGTASTFARIGSMSAPYIVDLLVFVLRNFKNEYWSPSYKRNLVSKKTKLVFNTLTVLYSN